MDQIRSNIPLMIYCKKILSEKMLLVASSLFFVNSVCAQLYIDSVFKFKHFINTGLITNSIVPSSTHSFYCQDSTIYLREFGSKKIHSFSPCTKNNFELKLPKKCKINIKYSREFCINENFLVCLSYEGIQVFKRKNKVYVWIYDYKFDQENFSSCKFINNNLYLERCYKYSSGKNQIQPCKIIKFDMENKRIEKEFSLDFKHIEFTLFTPNNFIDYTKNAILITNSNVYEIYVLDTNLNIKQIIHIKKEWRAIDTLVLKRIVQNVPLLQPKILIDSLRIYNQKNVDRIVEVNGIGDGFLIRQKYTNQKVVAKYDYWIRNNDSFILKLQNINERDFFSDTSLEISEDTFPFYSLSSPYITSNNYIFKIESIADFNYMNMNYQIALKNEDEYFKKYDPKIGIFIFKIN